MGKKEKKKEGIFIFKSKYKNILSFIHQTTFILIQVVAGDDGVRLRMFPIRKRQKTSANEGKEHNRTAQCALFCLT